MKIISTNIGEPKTISRKGKLVTTGIFKYSVKEPLILGSKDVENDHVIDRRYHGGQDKACYLYSADHYKYWKEIYPELEMPFGMFGENLTVEGLHEANINVGEIYKIGTALVQATQPRQPCFKLEFRFHDKNIKQKFEEAGFPGIYVRVLEKGKVKVGDKMELIERQDSISIQKVFKLLYAHDFDNAVLTAIHNPFIAESCKKDLQKRWSVFL